MSKRAALYTPVRSGDVPGGMKWKSSPGYPSDRVIVEYSMGNLYKRVTDASTRDVIYYRLLQEAPPATPADRIDAEPPKRPRAQYRLGTHCWFVDTDSRWYLCTVVARTHNKITVRPHTGHDATKEKPWPYGGELEFALHSPIFQRLRPLKCKQP